MLLYGAIPQFVNKYLALQGTRLFVTVFTKAGHLSLSWKQMNPVDCSIFVIFKIYFNSIPCLCLGFPSSLFSIPINILYVLYLAVMLMFITIIISFKVSGKD
jgi:hypothetical protein